MEWISFIKILLNVCLELHTTIKITDKNNDISNIERYHPSVYSLMLHTYYQAGEPPNPAADLGRRRHSWKTAGHFTKNPKF